MASISEIQEPEDRISDLPINLITHILSFLSTKDAVRTSALSTYWDQIWTLTTRLDFHDGLIMHQSSTPASRASFVNFVYRVLLFKVTPIDLFRLRGGRVYETTNVSQWISAAISRDVRKIDVDVRMPNICILPDCLFATKALVVLKLSGLFLLHVPDTICLQSLKICHFQSVEFVDGESFSRLVSSSPGLEELKIVGKLNERVKVLNISSLVLKRLILVGLYSLWFTENGTPYSYEIILNTPSLQYLQHHEDSGLPDGYHTNTLHCLDTAYLSFYQPCSEDLEDYDDELIPIRSIAELVGAISTVRFLYLIDDAFEALYELPNFELPKFPRLTYLKIDAIESEEGVRLIRDFLQSSPQLASLSFKIGPAYVFSYPPFTDVPFCMMYNLVVIEVDYFHEKEPMLSLVTYFLEKTKCLKELRIRRAQNKSEEFIKKLSMLPRASNSCKIVLT